MRDGELWPIFKVADGREGAAGMGTARVGLAVPSEPNLIGLELFRQFMFLDALAQEGVSAMNGFMFRIEP